MPGCIWIWPLGLIWAQHQGLGKNAQALGVRILSNFIQKYFAT